MFLDTSVYTQGTPVAILFQTLLLMMMYIFILVMLMLMFRIIGKKSFGIITSIGITFVGLPSYATSSPTRWIFPITHTAYNWHFNEFFSEPYCNMSTSYIYFITLIISSGASKGNPLQFNYRYLHSQGLISFHEYDIISKAD